MADQTRELMSNDYHQPPQGLPYSQACENNKGPILDKLWPYLATAKQVLEVGSGTGQHAVYFAEHLPHLQWQTSDIMAHHQGINAWIDAHPSVNLQRPITFDLRRPIEVSQRYDAVFTANTLHIIAWELVDVLFGLVGDILKKNGKFCIYGPFKYSGEFTSVSNEQFDISLRQRDQNSGIRDIEALLDLAKAVGLALQADYDLPANNQLLIFSKI
ncbi:MAG: DUF938 domain-containing protein [Psychrobacter sp.]|nr:DUF938 domain-containing protein [Psychrobacter sp.]